MPGHVPGGRRATADEPRGDADREATSTPLRPDSSLKSVLAALAAIVVLAPAAIAQVEIPQSGTATSQASSAPPPAPTSPAPTAQPAAGSADTAAAPVAVARVRLKLGSRGPVVRDLQRELRRRGARITVDGAFGPGTRRAVMRQQKRLHMPITGVADEKLLARLGLQQVRVAALKVSSAVPAGVRMDRWPVTGRLESPFGMRWGRMHEGIDIANALGTPIHAALPGVVSFAGTESGYGNLVRVDHGNGVETRYGHMSALRVAVGDPVATGDVVGLMGATGDATGVHLHFEVRVGGIADDPLTALPPRPGSVLPGL